MRVRPGFCRAAVALALFGAGDRASAASPFEDQVLAALNAARTDPAAYAAGLKRYRTYFHANLLRYPGEGADVETEEGAAAVDEAIVFLNHQAPLVPVESAPLFVASARDLVADQAQGGAGH